MDVQIVFPGWFIVVFFIFAGFLVILDSVLVDCRKKKGGRHDAPVHSAVVWVDMNIRQDDVVLGILI